MNRRPRPPDASGHAGPRDHREVVLVGTLALLSCVTAIVSSLGAPLVPAIATSYDTGLASAQWVITAAMIAGAVATPLIGRLGGGRHRRRTVVLVLAVVVAGCTLSALASARGWAFVWMVAGRALQGVGMALTPVALAVARDSVPGPWMQSSVALLSVATVAGAGLGYPLTGLVVEQAGLATAYAVGRASRVSRSFCVWSCCPRGSATASRSTGWGPS